MNAKKDKQEQKLPSLSRQMENREQTTETEKSIDFDEIDDDWDRGNTKGKVSKGGKKDLWRTISHKEEKKIKNLSPKRLLLDSEWREEDEKMIEKRRILLLFLLFP